MATAMTTADRPAHLERLGRLCVSVCVRPAGRAGNGATFLGSSDFKKKPLNESGVESNRGCLDASDQLKRHATGEEEQIAQFIYSRERKK